MSVLEWFSSQKEGSPSARSERLDIPGDLWIKCPSCGSVLYNKELEDNLKVCLSCSYHFRLSATERIGLTVDEKSFKELDASMTSKDFLNFTDLKSYKDRIQDSEKKSGIKDAIITGEATIEGLPLVISVMDFSYMGGSMGSVVGEKFTRAAEKALSSKVPFIVFTTSGGARMQEGIMSLMQMAKTSSILAKLSDAHLPYIVVLTDPTTGGTTASFAMLGDIHIAEKGALIGFAGPRVIEQTIRQKLPKGFQKAEYLEEHGFVDMVLARQDIKVYLARILKLFANHN
jgi:acetyl-CoA carboxylase carboxyl transferase subunit beta